MIGQFQLRFTIVNYVRGSKLEVMSLKHVTPLLEMPCRDLPNQYILPLKIDTQSE